MAVDLEARLRALLASAPQRLFEIVAVSAVHPLLSQDWHMWSQPYPGVITLETSEEVEVRPIALAVEPAGSPSNLDQVWRVAMDTVDPQDTFRAEMDRIPLDNDTPVELTFRSYISDDLADVQAIARTYVEVAAWERGKALLTAASPRFNQLRTGLTYAPRDIPMLRAFL